MCFPPNNSEWLCPNKRLIFDTKKKLIKNVFFRSLPPPEGETGILRFVPTNYQPNVRTLPIILNISYADYDNTKVDRFYSTIIPLRLKKSDVDMNIGLTHRVRLFFTFF